MAASFVIVREFRCATRSEDARIVVSVGGEIDRETAFVVQLALCDALTGRTQRAVVADLTHVDFIDASGLHAVAVAQDAACAYGVELVVRACPSVARVLDQCGLSERLCFEVADVDAPRAVGGS